MSVSSKEEIVIKDACIFFDLIDLGLLSSFYRLPFEVVTTLQVLGEITDEIQFAEVNSFIEMGHLQIDNFGLFETIALITETNKGISYVDASVLEAATRRNAAILSSDKSLRNESKRRDIVVHGLLWVLEELYNKEIISLDALLDKLEAYPIINNRAPKEEVEKLISKYKIQLYPAENGLRKSNII
ncbi:MAG: hypothetical protein IT260_12940 [Saprospiraceae bacterium]|nr:hypothetical protein [Saprospiraceae bacterium]